MKALLAFLLVLSQVAEGKALASIYNGEQYNLGGILLAQGSDQPNDFYVMPTMYYLESGRYYDSKLKKYVDFAGFTHTVTKDEKSGIEYSVYGFRFRLATPSDLELLVANQKLRMNKTTRQAEIKGPAPVCGVDLKVLGFESGQKISAVPIDPNATLIQYSIESSDGKCNSIMDVNEMSILYRVPLSQEPGVAKSLMSEEGLFLPNVELILPYKYKDTVKLTLDAESTIEQIKVLAGFTGTFKQVTAEVGATMQNLVNRLKVSSGITVDCQNPDKTVCNKFIDQAQDMMAKLLLVYTPEASKGDTNPLVVADKEKQASAFRVNLAYDSQSAKRIGKFVFDFSNMVYDSVRSQARFVANGVEVSAFHPKVQAKIAEDQK